MSNQTNGKSAVVLESLSPVTSSELEALPEPSTVPTEQPKLDSSASDEPKQLKGRKAAKEPKATRKGGGNNRKNRFTLDIDAGANRVKCRLNGEYKSFPSRVKLIQSDVPLRSDGCFSVKNKNYVVGNMTDRCNGELILGSQNNKLSQLTAWILGSLTHYRTHLKKTIGKANGQRSSHQPVQIELSIRLVTLSSMKRTELTKALKDIQCFKWEDIDFEVTVKSCEFIDEGEGAALEIVHTHNQTGRFHLLDLGGGTITHTVYDFGYDLTTVSKTPISGGGMVMLYNRISNALSRNDRGAFYAEEIDIQHALELATVNHQDADKCPYYCPLRVNGEVEDIGADVAGALSEWVVNNYSIRKMFDSLSQRLAKGEPVYFTGGGFACEIVSDWVQKYLSKNVENPLIKVLDNPQDINLTGLKHQDSKQ